MQVWHGEGKHYKVNDFRVSYSTSMYNASLNTVQNPLMFLIDFSAHNFSKY